MEIGDIFIGERAKQARHSQVKRNRDFAIFIISLFLSFSCSLVLSFSRSLVQSELKWKNRKKILDTNDMLSIVD